MFWLLPAIAVLFQSVPVERARVDVVLVEVLAFDGDDRPVTDLTDEDFRVTDGGKKVSIDSVDRIDLRVGDPGPGGVDARARFVIVIDGESMTRFERQRTYARLSEAVESMPALEGGAFALYSLETGPLTEGFVSDPDALRRALATSDEEIRERGAPSPAARDLTGVEERFDGCRRRNPGDAAAAFHCIRGEFDGFREEQTWRTRRLLADLDALSERFARSDATTFFLLVTPGFSLHPGRAAREVALEYMERGRSIDALDDAPERGPPHDPLSPLSTGPSLEPALRELIHTCLARRVIIHGFDVHNATLDSDRKADARMTSGSSRVSAGYRKFRDELHEGPAGLASGTGGFFSSGKTLKPLAGAVERSRFVYVLAYRAPEGKEGKFRKIRVKTTRRGVRLRHREGYFGTR